MEDELEDARDLQRLGEAFVDATRGDDDGVGDVDSELLEEKNEEITQLRDRVGDLEEHLENVQAERDDLATEVERLQGIEERVDQAERIEEQLDEARAVLGVEAPQPTAPPAENADDVAVAETTPHESTSADETTDVQEAILSEFRDDAVDRLVGKAESLSDRQRQLLKYIESRGKTLDSQKQWAKAALGLSSTPNTTHYDAMQGLIDEGFVRKNKDGSIAPNVRGLVEDELADYDVDDSTVDDCEQQVLARLAGRSAPQSG